MEEDLTCTSRLINATKAEEESQSQQLQREVDGPGPSQLPDDHVEVNAYHPRSPNVTDFVTQRCDDAADSTEGKDSHRNEHDAADHDDSHDEAYKDANRFIVRHINIINTNNKIRNEQEEPKQAATRSTTFPQHLMDVIEYESQYDKPNILDWVNGGGAFLIRDKVAFERSVLPQFFNRGRNKCKFMSFVRKIYRWGFRQQVERSSPDGISMTFMHPNFIRGDKQRCLLMRSIVKKPVRTSSLLRQSTAGEEQQRVVTLPQRVRQEDRVVVDVPTAAAAIPPLLLTHHPATTSQPFGPRVCQQQDVPILPLSLSVENLACQQGLNCPTSLQISATAVSNRFPAAMTSTTTSCSTTRNSRGGSGLHHSAEILERLLLQQRQQDGMVRYILVRINDGTIAAASLPPAALASLPPLNQPSMQPGQSAAALGSPAGACFGYHHADFCRRLTATASMNVVDPGGDMWVVAVLASQIMKSNPGIEPSRAIELAKKCCLPGHDTFLGSSVT